jgi:hypothetical protein
LLSLSSERVNERIVGDFIRRHSNTTHRFNHTERQRKISTVSLLGCDIDERGVQVHVCRNAASLSDGQDYTGAPSIGPSLRAVRQHPQ